MMGGDINLKSKEGDGTTFTVTIPTKVSVPKTQDVVQNTELTNAKNIAKVIISFFIFISLNVKTLIYKKAYEKSYANSK